MKMNRQKLISLLPILLLVLVMFANLHTNNADQQTMINLNDIHRGVMIHPWKKTVLNGNDGPYLFWKGDSLRVVKVNQANEMQQYIIKPGSATSFTTHVANKDQDQFSFKLNLNPTSPPAIYKQPKRLLAISDIEGNFNAFYSLLVGNGVMNEQYQWTFGDGHLVLLGDFVDRGDNVTQCLWLIYKLEQEAPEQGGRVHFILGNHEVMNLEYDFRYVHRKYLSLAQQLSGKSSPAEAFPYLMSEENVFVQWMRTRNCIEKIGDVLYVHGGISAELVAAKPTIDEINSLLRSYLRSIPDSNYVSDARTALVVGEAGPLWYRGMAKNKTEEHDKASPSAVAQVLRYFKAKKIVIGHTVMRTVSTDYNGKVILIDIVQPREKRTGKAEALFIENGKNYWVNDLGKRVLLK